MNKIDVTHYNNPLLEVGNFVLDQNKEMFILTKIEENFGYFVSFKSGKVRLSPLILFNKIDRVKLNPKDNNMGLVSMGYIVKDNEGRIGILSEEDFVLLRSGERQKIKYSYNYSPFYGEITIETE